MVPLLRDEPRFTSTKKKREIEGGMFTKERKGRRKTKHKHVQNLFDPPPLKGPFLCQKKNIKGWRGTRGGELGTESRSRQSRYILRIK